MMFMHRILYVIIGCCGLALLGAVGGIIFLTNQTLTYQGNDIAQAGILIGILGTVAANILGLFSGIAIGKALPHKPDDPPEPPA